MKKIGTKPWKNRHQKSTIFSPLVFHRLRLLDWKFQSRSEILNFFNLWALWGYRFATQEIESGHSRVLVSWLLSLHVLFRIPPNVTKKWQKRQKKCPKNDQKVAKKRIKVSGAPFADLLLRHPAEKFTLKKCSSQNSLGALVAWISPCHRDVRFDSNRTPPNPKGPKIEKFNLAWTSQSRLKTSCSRLKISMMTFTISHKKSCLVDGSLEILNLVWKFHSRALRESLAMRTCFFR